MFTTINNNSCNTSVWAEIKAKKVEGGNTIGANIANLSYLTSRDYLFIKIEVRGLKKLQKCCDVIMSVESEEVSLNEKINLYYIEEDDINDVTILNSAASFSENEYKSFDNLIEIVETNNIKTIKFHLDKFFKNKNTNSHVAVFAINFPNISSTISIGNPETTANYSIGIYDSCGINPIYKYDEHDFGSAGNVKVNLFNGQYTYTLPLLQSLSTKMPITFSLYQADYRNDSIKHLKNKKNSLN